MTTDTSRKRRIEPHVHHVAVPPEADAAAPICSVEQGHYHEVDMGRGLLKERDGHTHNLTRGGRGSRIVRSNISSSVEIKPFAPAPGRPEDTRG